MCAVCTHSISRPNTPIEPHTHAFNWNINNRNVCLQWNARIIKQLERVNDAFQLVFSSLRFVLFVSFLYSSMHLVIILFNYTPLQTNDDLTAVYFKSSALLISLSRSLIILCVQFQLHFFGSLSSYSFIFQTLQNEIQIDNNLRVLRQPPVYIKLYSHLTMFTNGFSADSIWTCLYVCVCVYIFMFFIHSFCTYLTID